MFFHRSLKAGNHVTRRRGKITASTFNKKSAACTVTVSDDFVFSGRTLIKYKGNKRTVTIPPVNTNGDTILSIGESAFEGNTTVTKVIIPDTVKTIGNNAFKDCTALQSVTLPASLTTIGEQAFCGDTSLKTLYIPHGTTTISPGAFAESSLEEIYLPDTVTSIDDSAFDGLPDLIFYAPYGSYAYEYAQEKDYQTEDSGTGYREDQLQEQLKILEELESAGESEPAEPMEFEFLDDEGIEDEELLAFIADVNNTIQASRNSYYQYMQTAEGLSDAYDGLGDKAESLNIDVSDGNISLESDDISYTLGGEAIDVLGSDYTILSATADESQGVLRLEIESGGKKYNLVEDANGITVNEIGNSVGIAASDVQVITPKAAAAATENRLYDFLMIVRDKVNDLEQYISAITDAVSNAVENAESMLAAQQTCVSHLEEQILYAREQASKEIFESSTNPDYLVQKQVKEQWAQKLISLNSTLSRQKNNLRIAEKIVAAARGLSTAIKALNPMASVVTILNDIDRFMLVREIKSHGHPTQIEAGDATLRQIANDLNQNINLCYMAIGFEALTAFLDLCESLSNVMFVVEVSAGPAGIPLIAFRRVAVNAVRNTVMTYVRHIGLRMAVSTCSEHYYTIVKKDDDKLHRYVYGTVTDKENNNPIPRVAVTCGVNKTYSNSNGWYFIKVGDGPQTITFTKKDYHQEKRQINMGVEDPSPLDIAMSSKGIVSGYVRDSANGQPLSGVYVTYGYYATTTNDDGFYQFEVPVGREDMSFSKEDYIPVEVKSVEAKCDQTTTQNAVLARELDDDQYQVVLAWGATPRDLDAHLEGPGFHVYFEDKYAQDAWLDTDDTESYGPETITFTIDEGSEYVYYVHDYTNKDAIICGDLGYSGATVAVYHGSEHLGTYSVPNEPGLKWYVFRIRNGELIPINKVY